MAKKSRKVSVEYKKIIAGLDSIEGLSVDEKKLVSEAADIISDYEAATAETTELIRKYETEVRPIKRAKDYYQCPECMKRTSERHSHCHWCGKKLGW